MLSGFIVIIIVTSIDFGGYSNVFDKAVNGNRFPSQFEFDPRYRHTFWTVFIGNCTGAEMASFVCQQYKVQRYLSCKSLKEAQKCIFYSIPVTCGISIMALLTGLCAYAYFEECDPWKNGWIQERDQIIPYLSLYMFGTVAPGVAGIYMSAVFGASLSTCSSSINSCAVVIIQDLLKPFLKIKPSVIPWLSKVIMLIIGAAIIGFAYLAKNFEGILEACQSINGCVSGPTLGLFTLGIFFPFVSELPAIIGLISGLAISIWVYVGSNIFPPGSNWTRQQSLNISSCTNSIMENKMNEVDHQTYSLLNEIKASEDDSTGIYGLYHMSYAYLGTIGMTTTLTIGILLAFIVNGVSNGDIFISSKTAPEGTTWFNKFSEKHFSNKNSSQISPEVYDTTHDENTNQINNEKRPSETDL